MKTQNCNEKSHSKKAKIYKFTIDKEKYESKEPELTGQQIIELTGKPVGSWCLLQKLKGGVREPIELPEIVDLSLPGRERFEMIPKQVQNGEAPIHTDILKEEDIEYLDANFKNWRCVKNAQFPGVYIESFDLPKPLLPETSDIFFLIPHNYLSGAALDMFFLKEDVAKTSGLSIAALSSRAINGENWFQWSRHRLSDTPWRPGIDNLATHIELSKVALLNEAAKQGS